jgi:predicted Zn-ribbon and HTH transcriptional regulator
MDRTKEFFSLVDEIIVNQPIKNPKQPLKQPKIQPQQDITNITENSSKISRALTQLGKKLQQLEIECKNTGIFENSEESVNELSRIIDGDFKQINESVVGVLKMIQNNKMNEQTRAHCKEIVEYLELNLSELALKYSKIMKARREVFIVMKSYCF